MSELEALRNVHAVALALWSSGRADLDGKTHRVSTWLHGELGMALSEASYARAGLTPESRAIVERLEANACHSCGAEPTLVTDGSGEERQVVHAKGCSLVPQPLPQRRHRP